MNNIKTIDAANNIYFFLGDELREDKSRKLEFLNENGVPHCMQTSLPARALSAINLELPQ